MHAEADEIFSVGRLIGGKSISEKITIRWIQTFTEANGLVIRIQAGSLLVSPEKQLFLEKSVAFHLGKLKRGFESGDYIEEMMENADETHFIFNMDNSRTIGFKGQEKVKYADVVAGDEGITMMVRITGEVGAIIAGPMLIFKNDNNSYPIRGVSDDVPGVCYRSGKKGWIDRRVFKEWLREPHAIKKDIDGRNRFLFVYKCSGNNVSDGVLECLTAIQTKLRKLPANANDLFQPADSFVISKIRDAWRRQWDRYKVGLLSRGEWMGSGEGRAEN